MVNQKVMLVGGPDYFPGSARFQLVADLTEKVKIVLRDGYEHFSHSGEMSFVEGEHLPVFRWCGKTRFAE
ncbi:MAG: DUF5988 family protein [Streptosporangiaceae bacterium]|jgi:hypothetical protein